MSDLITNLLGRTAVIRKYSNEKQKDMLHDSGVIVAVSTNDGGYVRVVIDIPDEPLVVMPVEFVAIVR